ncbi:hydantoinase/oxoprolinase family protein [Methanohalophilus mahii]|uniref:Hydantoinase/oxoprolinase n=1 Tax=Methanohalophilus mahii (strain ATCC 35705 / DSM 5219 / SLP) TaxID=547558 RepID=D5EBF0_METMS|nr:hydantoinase/oxoprolinase family protein [Methanohalophilus mahii]ADE36501.1 Hydantoinase/oxoprolinase [Methanohalophilus mahii DSM 5219]
MKYSLGIDAGGTYTDVVIIENNSGEVVSSNKALTTYPDLLEGIENSIDGLDFQYLEDIAVVSVSTTLATNTVLENTGYPVALILIGEHGSESEGFPSQHIFHANGGHDHKGLEMQELDIKTIESFVENVKDKVSAFAISSHFSIRNPDHEIKTREMIQTIVDMPVVCGHELSQDIGAYERAVTATLNARLIPVIKQFIETIVKEIRRRGISARLLMLKCDGSVTGIEDALKKPIETVFSGPAASLIGASHLSGRHTCVTIDVGGTSTDVSSISKGVPELSESGGIVGGWKTRVRAIHMETSAMGGDSGIWTRKGGLFIGPRRVIPLSLAAEMYPGFVSKLKNASHPQRDICDENIQPARFFVKNGSGKHELTDSERKVLDVLGNEPMSYRELTSISRSHISSNMLDSLISKRFIRVIGFTPTDVLHVLGDYEQWNVEAASIGADILARFAFSSKFEICETLKEKFALNMAYDLMCFSLPNIEKESIMDTLTGNYSATFKMKLPVVLIGGPVAPYVKLLGKIVDADIILPDHADVGNAIGALYGKGIKRLEYLIRPASLSEPDQDFIVFSQNGRKSFQTYTQAYDYSIDNGKNVLFEYMKSCGIKKDQISFNIKEKKIIPEGWKHPPMETQLTIMGIGTSPL